MNERNDKSPHILNTSATLLGLCFVVLTSHNILTMKGATYIDELTALAILMFITSCVLSFISMRRSSSISKQFENIADIVFFIGLFFLFTTTILITFDIIS